MAIVNVNVKNLHEACISLNDLLKTLSRAPASHQMWRAKLQDVDLPSLLGLVRGSPRFFFKSRDRDYEILGFGAADQVMTSIPEIVDKAKDLLPDQIYFGGSRFDKHREIAPEWDSFGPELFILPLVCLLRKNGVLTFSLNWQADGSIPWPLWCDQACTLLNALSRNGPIKKAELSFESPEYLPAKDGYADNVQRALNDLTNENACKKVVIGRRHALQIDEDIDPSSLFVRLKERSTSAFLFFFDNSKGSAFFGASPELLYRRTDRLIETESLAGTRARACDEWQDDVLRMELLKSFKDHREHELVSLHIEDKLKEIGIKDLSSSKLEIMALSYVQHLLKRYRGRLNADVRDDQILHTLHPTPAVCGLDIAWARDFIRTHEGFDRGFYAGPIGFIANDQAEFAVAIRSALHFEKRLYVYAACGIVPGSVHAQEWEELNNKEKNIMGIFDV